MEISQNELQVIALIIKHRVVDEDMVASELGMNWVRVEHTVNLLLNKNLIGSHSETGIDVGYTLTEDGRAFVVENDMDVMD